MDIIFDSNFQELLKKLSRPSITEEKIVTYLCEYIHSIHKILNIGKLEIVKNEKNINIINHSLSIFECEKYGNLCYKKTFNFDGNKIISLVIHNDIDLNWNKKQINCINALFEFIYIIYTRTLYLDLLNQSIITDPLTDILNTEGLILEGIKLFNKQLLMNYCCLFTNIKNFKFINQTIGTQKGNEVLKNYAIALNDKMQNNEYVCRAGGDNFILLIKKENLDFMLDSLQNVQVFVKNNNNDLQCFYISNHIGIYEINKDNHISIALENASIVLNIIKNNKKEDILFFSQEMMEKFLYEKKISNDFKDALQNKEFIVYYQPKVNSQTYELCGCEALVRWFKDDKIISPMKFVPILEKEQTICLLDLYVFEETCKNIKNWLNKGYNVVKTSINFSKENLRNNNLSSKILSIIKKYNIDTKYIEIELTETSGYENFENLTNFVNEMKLNNINVSIDDFGTGYSSLNLIKDLNIDVIKLDKSFVSNLNQKSEKDKIILKSIVNMIKELNINVIAEGVETIDQLKFLQSIGCYNIQGYLFDKPLSLEEFEIRLKNKKYENI